MGDAFAASRFAGCHATDGVGRKKIVISERERKVSSLLNQLAVSFTGPRCWCSQHEPYAWFTLTA